MALLDEPLTDRGDVFIVIPVHNRRKITMNCLESLNSTGVLEWTRVIVVDDGSTDGTSEAIREKFPEVIILKGDGNLWWTGAIVLGMKEAVRQQAGIIVWLNDDTKLRAGSMATLVEHTAKTGAVAVGQVLSPFGLPYAGWKKTTWDVSQVGLEPGSAMACDTFNGNLVALPAKVIREIGYPNADDFPHVYGDSDYGFRVRAAGFPIVGLADAVADELVVYKPHAVSWLLDDRSNIELWQTLTKRTNVLNPKAQWLYRTRHWGFLGAVRVILSYLKLATFLAIKTVLPKAWLIRFSGRHSPAFNAPSAENGPAETRPVE